MKSISIVDAALLAMTLAIVTGPASLGARTDEAPSGQVFVTTVPEKAIVSCDGAPHDVSPLTISDLPPGDHIISATKQGFQDASQTVNIRAGAKVAVELALDPILGLVLVHSSPSGADVKISGAFRGKTPVLVTDLPTGRYRVQIEKPGHSSREVELVVKDRIPLKIDVNLSSEASSLTVASTPEGAKVTVDGISKGLTPCTVDVAPGEHAIDLDMDGFVSFKQKIRIAAGRTETVNVDLKELTAELQIVTTPEKAKVYLNDQLKGEAPLSIQDLQPGAYRVRVQMPGHEPMARDITLGRGQKLTEEFGLISTSGTFEISTIPSGVKVVVDGKDAGVTESRTNDQEAASEILRIESLEAGRHQVELLRHGYAPRTFNIDIEAAKTAAAKGVRLERRFTPDFEIRTVSQVYKGVLIAKEPDGSVRMEVRPGVTMKFEPGDIRYAAPIRQ